MKNFIIVALLLLCAYLFFLYKAPVVNDKMPNEAKDLVEAVVKDVNKKIDEKGFEHAVIEEVQNTITTIYQMDSSAISERDSVVKLLKIERSQLKEWQQNAITWRDSFLIAKQRSDTVYSYTDKWADIDFVKPKNDTPYFNFKYDAEINYAKYDERKWLLGKKRDYVDFWINDQRATINGVKRLKFEVPERMWGAEVNAHGLYTDRLNLGFEGMVRFGRYKAGGGYYYDMNTNDWKPMLSVKFKVLDF